MIRWAPASLALFLCGFDQRSTTRSPARGRWHDEAFVTQDSEGFLGGAFGDPVALGDALDRRHRLARGDLPRRDHLAQDAGKLQVGRLPSEMINGHMASVGIPWQT